MIEEIEVQFNKIEQIALDISRGCGIPATYSSIHSYRFSILHLSIFEAIYISSGDIVLSFRQKCEIILGCLPDLTA